MLWGSFPMVPWAGRLLAHGRFNFFGGQTYEVRWICPSAPCSTARAPHGLGRSSPTARLGEPSATGRRGPSAGTPSQRFHAL